MKRLFGLNFYDKDINSLVNTLIDDIKNGRKKSIFTPNIDHLINNDNNDLARIKYSKSEYIIADGWPLVATARFKGKHIERITGVDLMDALLEKANSNGYNIYFLGATDSTLNKLKKNIIIKKPNIGNIGCHNGYFKCDKDVIDDINLNETNILFVGMGNPKQEIWIRDNFEKLNANLMIGVGGALNIFSNEVERAPKFIQSIGMEWFYRFLKEPKRLFSRYFIKYPKFISIFCKEIFVNEKEEDFNN